MQNRLILPRKAHSRGIYPAELVLPGISRREIHLETRIILREAAAGGRGRPLVGQDHTGQTADGPKETDARRRTRNTIIRVTQCGAPMSLMTSAEMPRREFLLDMGRRGARYPYPRETYRNNPPGQPTGTTHRNPRPLRLIHTPTIEYLEQLHIRSYNKLIRISALNLCYFSSL